MTDNIEIRTAENLDIPNLKKIWQSCFSDTDREIDRFFEAFFQPGFSLIMTENKEPAAAAHLVGIGELHESGKALNCAYAYGIGVISRCRKLGYGSNITKAIISQASLLGFDCCALVPASRGLFRFYNENIENSCRLYVNEYNLVYSGAGKIRELKNLSASEYSNIRESILSGTAHIKFNHQAMAYLDALLSDSGGGFLQYADSVVAAVELSGDCALIKEMLGDQQSIDSFAQEIMRHYGKKRCEIRTPGNNKPFAILDRRTKHPAYFGFAFD